MANIKYQLLNEASHQFNSDNFYVYELVNPVTNLPFYVGKGRQDRAWRHICFRNNKKICASNPHKMNTINKIINDGNFVLVKIVSTHSTECQAFAAERLLIANYGRQCDASGILTNITQGGEGNSRSGVSVDQFTMFGEYVMTYANAKEAARQNKWNNYSTICGCCKGRERSYKGFLWAYTGNQPVLLTKIKPIYQWSHTGGYVGKYRSISDAARAVRCDPSTIRDCLYGHSRQAVGYLWSYNKRCPDFRPRCDLKKPVLFINKNIVYLSVTAAALATNHNIGAVSACCKGTRLDIAGDKFKYV